MSIPLNSICYQCLVGKHTQRARELGDDATATAFSRDLMALLLAAEPEADSAVMADRINDLYVRYFHLPRDRYREEKAQSNAFVLSRLGRIEAQAEESPDPVYAALQSAVLGNYLDFAALGNRVSFEKLDSLLSDALKMELDRAVYGEFCRDLEKAKTLLYLCDNAGEIGFDRVLAQQLQKKYPQLQITFCVRGEPVHNDATREDAAFVGIPFPVIDNGTAIGGTPVRLVNEETRNALEQADVVLAKGMGNTESMLGCGYHVYYAFLIKCPRFQQYFEKDMMTPMFIKERTGQF